MSQPAAPPSVPVPVPENEPAPGPRHARQPSQQPGYPPPIPYPPALEPSTAHPAPGYPPPAYPVEHGFHPVPPRRLPLVRTSLIVLAVVAAVVGGASVAGHRLLANNHRPTTAHTTLSTPETLGDRPRITTPELLTTLDTAVAEMKKRLPGTTSTVAAAYGSLADRDLVLVVGAVTAVTDMRRTLAEFTGDVDVDGTPVTHRASVPPGPLGGVAECGDATAAGISVTICAWADGGSAGTIVTYFDGATHAREHFVELRNAVEQRG